VITPAPIPVHDHVEQIERSRKAAVSLPAATATWLGEITDDLHEKLAALGLVAPRSQPDNGGIPTTIGRLWDEFFVRRPDLKKWTRSNLEQTKLRCVEFFKHKPAAAITQGDAKDFRRWLVEKEYSPATVRHNVEFRDGCVHANQPKPLSPATSHPRPAARDLPSYGRQ
jgi:hypothetical protein